MINQRASEEWKSLHFEEKQILHRINKINRKLLNKTSKTLGDKLALEALRRRLSRIREKKLTIIKRYFG